MNKKNTIGSIVVLLFIIIGIYCFFYKIQNDSPSYNHKINLSGVLIENEWNKSINSYCAQGSKYFSLKTNKEEVILEFEPAYSESQMTNFSGKNVNVNGEKKLRKIKCSYGKQCPIIPEGDFSCEILKVNKINSIQ